MRRQSVHWEPPEAASEQAPTVSPYARVPSVGSSHPPEPDYYEVAVIDPQAQHPKAECLAQILIRKPRAKERPIRIRRVNARPLIRKPRLMAAASTQRTSVS